MKKFFPALAIVSLISGAYLGYKSLKYSKELVPGAVEIREVAMQQTKSSVLEQHSASKTTKVQKPAPPLPSSFNLKMAFYPQAPYADWSLPWQEACEEASILLVANAYLDKNWSRQQFNDQILKLVAWEKDYFGYYEHTTNYEMTELLDRYFGLKTVIHENPTYTDIQTIISQGHVIIMTFAGKKLRNPFYRHGGPIYHAMVIKGYKEGEKVITHDVGTRRGEDYVYRWSVIQEALHDYAQPIEQGAKRMIEVIPPSSQ